MLFVDESVAPAATAIYEACEKSKEPEETEGPPVTQTPTPTLSTTSETPQVTEETSVPTEETEVNPDPGGTPTP
jgi:hypothetical protein